MFGVLRHMRSAVGPAKSERAIAAALLAGVTGLLALAAVTLIGISGLIVGNDGHEASAPLRSAGAVLGDSDDWMAAVKSERFWQAGRNGNTSMSVRDMTRMPARSGLGGLEPVARPDPSGLWPGWFGGNGEGWQSFPSGGTTYRTMCVRLCDGYFWPVSFSTTSDNFERDSRICEQSCSSPARLYVYASPGVEAGDMRSVRGEPYTRLRTAFQFRTKYDENCKCKPHPWEQQAIDRHRQYALEASRGRTVAATVAPPAANAGRRGAAAKTGTAPTRSALVKLPSDLALPKANLAAPVVADKPEAPAASAPGPRTSPPGDAAASKRGRGNAPAGKGRRPDSEAMGLGAERQPPAIAREAGSRPLAKAMEPR